MSGGAHARSDALTTSSLQKLADTIVGKKNYGVILVVFFFLFPNGTLAFFLASFDIPSCTVYHTPIDCRFVRLYIVVCNIPTFASHVSTQSSTDPAECSHLAVAPLFPQA